MSFLQKKKKTRNPLAVQWLGFRASTAGGMGSIPGQGTKIPHAMQHGQKERERETNKGFLSQIQDILEGLGGELTSCCLELLTPSCSQKGKYHLFTH